MGRCYTGDIDGEVVGLQASNDADFFDVERQHRKSYPTGEEHQPCHAVLETGPKAVAGVRADDGPGRAFLHLPPSVQSVVGGGIGRVVETTRLVLR